MATLNYQRVYLTICPSSLYPHYLPTLLVILSSWTPIYEQNIPCITGNITSVLLKFLLPTKMRGVVFQPCYWGSWQPSSTAPADGLSLPGCRLRGANGAPADSGSTCCAGWRCLWRCAGGRQPGFWTPKVYSKIWGLSHSIHHKWVIVISKL